MALCPRWGARFIGGKDTFREAVWQAWRQHRSSVIVVLVAGNDLNDRCDAVKLAEEMQRLRDYWLSWDIRVLYVDVVPPLYHRY